MPDAKKEFAYIPALPGFNLVEFMGNEAHLSPIIAWEIVRDIGVAPGSKNFTMIFPVTVEGVNDTDAIQYPDGRVTIPMDTVYASVEDWLREKLELAKDRAQSE